MAESRGAVRYLRRAMTLTMFAMVSNKGWEPGIGDPTFMGWFTVVAYFVASICCARLAWSQLLPRGYVRNLQELVFWSLAAVGLFLLGINKQLDLQTWFTEIGREISVKQGWYEKRRLFQVCFISALILLGLAFSKFLFRLTRGALQKNWLALGGGIFLVLFVIIRASSFHHVDEMLGKKIGKAKINWIIELSGIALILAGAIPQLISNRRSKNFPKPERVEAPKSKPIGAGSRS